MGAEVAGEVAFALSGVRCNCITGFLSKIPLFQLLVSYSNVRTS